MKAWFQNFMRNLLRAIGMGVAGLLFMGLGVWMDPTYPAPPDTSWRPRPLPLPSAASAPALTPRLDELIRQSDARMSAARAAASAPLFRALPAASAAPSASSPLRSVAPEEDAYKPRERPGIVKGTIHALETAFPGKPDSFRGWVAKGFEWLGGILVVLAMFHLLLSPVYPSRKNAA